MLEQEYIDLCNELKTKYDNLQKEKDKLTQERERIIRVLTILYGLIRMLKTIINNIEDLPCICRHLVEYLYSEIDNLLFESGDFDALSIHSLDIIDI